MEHPQMHEDFLEFESKVNQVLKLLEDMKSSTKGDSEAGNTESTALDGFDENNCIITTPWNRTVINKKALKEEPPKQKSPMNLDKFTFMQQLEEDANKRYKVRQQQQRMAQKFRKAGNEAFRNSNYHKAIIEYNHAIEHVKDSPILYNNRCLCYIRLKNYKRALMDVEHVLNKLDEKNIRSWLYRAAAYMRLGDTVNYENSVKLARKFNTKESQYIDEFVEKLATGMF